ncbi:transcription termination/antitermination protein NusG [Anatilimnocola sp. NA78]|uniref:transcription termination/antitermination protein NusG n=1 Tax=Anatilimnocola sp. NA78 TaxID=3415683 RepID=UPI003CE54EC3
MHPDSPENSELAAGPATSGDVVPPVEPVAATPSQPQPDDVTPSSSEALHAMSQTGDVEARPSSESPATDDVTPEPEEEEEEPASSTAGPLEFIDESRLDDSLQFDWYILKIQVNREDSIRDALLRRIKMNGVERYFKDVVVPTEDVAEFTKTGKRKVVKKKLYPGYLLINMAVNDESWFAIRETAGIGDFTGSGGKPTPMLPRDVDTILRKSKVITDEATPVKSTIPFKKDDRVRVKEGNFQNFEGEVASVDQANGRVKVLIPIFGRSTEIEFQHWQIELV